MAFDPYERAAIERRIAELEARVAQVTPDSESARVRQMAESRKIMDELKELYDKLESDPECGSP